MEMLRVEKMIESFPSSDDEEIKLLKNEALKCWERIEATVGKPVEESRTYVEAQLISLFKILDDLQNALERICSRKDKSNRHSWQGECFKKAAENRKRMDQERTHICITPKREFFRRKNLTNGEKSVWLNQTKCKFFSR